MVRRQQAADQGDPAEAEVAWSSEIPAPCRGAFWAQIATGLLPEEAAGVIGVAQAVGSRWFHKAGGMPPFDLKFQPSGRYLPSLSARRSRCSRPRQGRA